MFDLHKPHAQCVLVFIKSIITQVVFDYSVRLGLRVVATRDMTYPILVLSWHCKRNSFNIILVFNLYL